MKTFYSWVVLLAVVGVNSQDLFDLSDAVEPAPTAPPKVPEKPKLAVPTKPPPKKKPAGDDFGFNLGDALGPDPNPKPDKPVIHKTGGGGGSFDDSDLADVGKGDYKPDGGNSGGAGARDPRYNADGEGGDQPQEAGAGQIAGIASAIGMAIVGAASGYFAYQKKKLCFKLQGGVDPESGKNYQGDQSQPQLLSNLLKT